MDGLSRFLFYLIIFGLWIFINRVQSAKNRQSRSRQRPLPHGTGNPRRDSSRPDREGEEYFLTGYPTPEPAGKPEERPLSFDEMVALQREQAAVPQEKQIELEIPPAAPEPAESKPLFPKPDDKKNAPPILKSGVKEGIIWSIVLGQPRCRQRYNREKPPVLR